MAETLRLLSTWVKHPALRGADLLVVAECVRTVWPELYGELSQGRAPLSICPEAENDAHVVGKLSSMIRSSMPRSLAVLSVAGSPHCSLLHHLVNEAIYVAGAHGLPLTHLVILEGKVQEVSAAAVRVARYLPLVEELVRRDPGILEELSRYSLEHRAAKGSCDVHPA
ncbi:4Fe-4S ferredoxin [Candidatus Bipolaricaulota sp. J31]